MIRICILSFICFAFLACNREFKKIEITDRGDFKQKVSVNQVSQIQLELDSVTSPLINALQEFDNEGNEFLMYLNEETGDLFINDLKTKQIVKKITVKDGLENHKKLYQGFHYHNKDSIFVFSFKPKVTLINGAGEVKNEYVLRNDNIDEKSDDIVYRGIWSSTINQSYLLGDTLFLNSVRAGGNKTGYKKIQILLNVKDGHSSLGSVLVPKRYANYDFGDVHFDTYASCVNTNNNLLVYSFPGYENVIVDSLATHKIYERTAESSSISYFIEFDKSNYEKSKPKETFEYFMTSPSYGAIYYDKYKDLYYRIALLPVNEKNVNYDERNAPLKQLSIVVLDKNFVYLGEKLLERNKYVTSSAFVSRSGLHIQNRMESDQTLDFSTFTVEPTK